MKRLALLVGCIMMLGCVDCFSQPSGYDQEEVDRLLRYRALDLDPQMLGKVIDLGEIALLDYGFNPIQLGLLDSMHLRLLRNLIFAQHGLIFQSTDLSVFFSTFPWYTPTMTDVGSLLTSTDQNNLIHIAGLEAKNPTVSPEDEQLVGVWQDMPVMAAGWSERFIFFQSGDVFYGLSTMKKLPSVRFFAGKYEIIEGFLLMTFTDVKVVRHSNEIEYSTGMGYQWKESDTRYIVLDEPLVIRLPIYWIREIDLDKAGHRTELNIAGFLYYWMASDPLDGIYK